VHDDGPVDYIQVTARPAMGVSVKNSRNGFQKSYAAKP
jgi:hypothetical protein